MSRLVYFDCFSGISGDMALGALLDAGLPLDELRRAFGSLALPGVHVHANRVPRAGVSATKFTVHAHDHGASPHDHHGHGHQHDHAHPHRSLPEIFGLIDRSALPASGRELSSAPAIEFYLNSPQFTPPEQLRTEIWLPLVG